MILQGGKKRRHWPWSVRQRHDPLAPRNPYREPRTKSEIRARRGLRGFWRSFRDPPHFSLRAVGLAIAFAELWQLEGGEAAGAIFAGMVVFAYATWRLWGWRRRWEWE